LGVSELWIPSQKRRLVRIVERRKQFGPVVNWPLPKSVGSERGGAGREELFRSEKVNRIK